MRQTLESTTTKPRTEAKEPIIKHESTCRASHLLCIEEIHKTMFTLLTMPISKPVKILVYLPISRFDNYSSHGYLI